jgi:murein DD-endopeptidase / murein LD-carboxypeptidase
LPTASSQLFKIENNSHIYSAYIAEFLMMKGFFETKGYLFALLVTVCQLLNSFCSKQLYPGTSFQNIESHAEKKKLKDFMDAGTEKGINTRNTSADEIIKTAQKYLGVPWCMGGTTMKCMDCSGLLVTVFAKHGIHLPHNSEEQARYGKIIAGMDELRKGDLVFFIRSYKTHYFITHSGIYLGNNKFIHTSSKNGVSITSLNDRWWKEKFIFGTRVF